MAIRRYASWALVAVTLAACSNGPKVTPVTDAEYNNDRNNNGQVGTLFGEGGLSLGGGKGNNASQDGGGALGVNAYLWRGTLDTLSFMPLASADPFGGVIITDWYQPPAATGERFKATAYILGRQLRSDGLRVSIFRQVLQNGQWVDAAVSPQTTGEIEDKILQRARELRAQSAASG
jgi:hypothetical protein